MFRAQVTRITAEGKVFVKSATYGSNMEITGPTGNSPLVVGDQVICDIIHNIKDNIVILSKVYENNLETREDYEDLDARLDAAESSLVLLDSRLDAAESSLTSLDGRLDSLEPRVTTTENTLVSHTNWLNWHDIDIAALDGRLDLLEPRVTGVEGVNTTQNTRLDGVESVNTSQNTRLTNIESLNTTQNTRLTNIESLNTTQNTRLDGIDTLNTTNGGRITTLETWKSATKTWSANTGPSHFDIPFASITPVDVPGLSITLPVTGTQDIYMVVIMLIIEYVFTEASNKMLEARLNISGVDSVEEINYRMPATAATVTGARTTVGRTYFATSMAAGGRILKVRANQHAVGTQTHLRIHANSSIKIVRLN